MSLAGLIAGMAATAAGAASSAIKNNNKNKGSSTSSSSSSSGSSSSGSSGGGSSGSSLSGSSGGSSGGGSSGSALSSSSGGKYQNIDLGDTFWSMVADGSTDADYLQDIVDARADKASSTPGLGQYVGDREQERMQAYVNQLRKNENLQNQAWADYQSNMQQAADQQQAAIQASVDSAIAGLNAQKGDVGKLTEANNAAAERAYMQTVNPNGSLAENLAANGLLPTGVTETSQIQAGNTYQNALNENATTQTEALAEIERAITQAQLTGDIQAAQALSDLLTQIAEQGYSHVQDILAQNQWQSQFGQNLGVTNAELTGIYNGQPTLEAQRLQADLAAAEDQRKVVQQQLQLGEIDQETARKQLDLLDRQIQELEQNIVLLKQQQRYNELQM